MDAYAKYFLKCLYEFGISTIVIKHHYIDDNKHIYWEDTDEMPGCRKVSIVGGFKNGVLYWVNDGTKALRFDDNWTTPNTVTFSIDADGNATYNADNTVEDTIDGINALSSFFLQTMLFVEKHNVYLSYKVLFSKGTCYQHLMNAELTC